MLHNSIKCKKFLLPILCLLPALYSLFFSKYYVLSHPTSGDFFGLKSEWFKNFKMMPISEREPVEFARTLNLDGTTLLSNNYRVLCMETSDNNSSAPIFHLIVKDEESDEESGCEKFEITVNNDDQSRDSAVKLTESFTLNVKGSPIKSESFVFKESPIPFYIAAIVHERVPEAYNVSLAVIVNGNSMETAVVDGLEKQRGDDKVSIYGLLKVRLDLINNEYVRLKPIMAEKQDHELCIDQESEQFLLISQSPFIRPCTFKVKSEFKLAPYHLPDLFAGKLSETTHLIQAKLPNKERINLSYSYSQIKLMASVLTSVKPSKSNKESRVALISAPTKDVRI